MKRQRALRACYGAPVPPMPGTGEILLIVMLVAIVFFGEKVSALGDALGRARSEFRRGQTDDERIAVRPVDEGAPPAAGASAEASGEKHDGRAGSS